MEARAAGGIKRSRTEGLLAVTCLYFTLTSNRSCPLVLRGCGVKEGIAIEWAMRDGDALDDR